eukprot:GHVU01218141.1.p3 GENE.GHVU01218141.1~~GHVU01218141.1.p3  ORF type:complete len:135 (+),score=34.27 GHVU01218141.1:370-774(+)
MHHQYTLHYALTMPNSILHPSIYLLGSIYSWYVLLSSIHPSVHPSPIYLMMRIGCCFRSRRRGGGEDGDEEEGLADETDALMEDQNTAFDEEEEKDAETFVEIERDASFWAGEDDVEDDQYAVREGYGEGFEEE